MGVNMSYWRTAFCAALAATAIAVSASAQVKRAGAVVNSPAVATITLPDGTYITPPITVTMDAAGNVISPGTLPPATSTPLTGTSTGQQVVGPFVPVPGRPITITLSASPWPGGTVQLLRSTDDGLTKLPLTPAGILMGVYSGIGVDTPWTETEKVATFYLSLPGAGISYRVAQ